MANNQEMKMIWLSDDFCINFNSSEIIQDGHIVGRIKGKIIYRMLFYFCAHLDQILTKNQIIGYVWNRDSDDTSTDENFNGYISKIRKLHPVLNDLLETKIGIGYMMHCKMKCKKMDYKNTIEKLNCIDYAEYTLENQKDVLACINLFY